MSTLPEAMISQLLSELRQVREDLAALRAEVRNATRPALVEAEWLAWRSGCSVDTVNRRAKEWGIPRRDLNGDIKASPTGPVRYSLTEWEAAERLHTRVVKRSARRENGSHGL